MKIKVKVKEEGEAVEEEGVVVEERDLKISITKRIVIALEEKEEIKFLANVFNVL
jgi:hypothetical protein